MFEFSKEDLKRAADLISFSVMMKAGMEEIHQTSLLEALFADDENDAQLRLDILDMEKQEFYPACCSLRCEVPRGILNCAHGFPSSLNFYHRNQK